MNKLLNKAIAVCKVFFNVLNSVEKLPEYAPSWTTLKLFLLPAIIKHNRHK